MSESTSGGDTATLEPASRRPRTTGTRLSRLPGLGTVSLWALLVTPIVLALAEALRSPRLNYWDFWHALSLTTDANGSLDPSTFGRLYNEHPIITVAMTFWVDAKLFAGANWTLGVATVLLALVTYAALWSMLPEKLTGLPRLAVLAALSLLVFSSAGMDYFGAGWMGIQWFVGIAPAVVAIAFAHRGRTVPAMLLALIACLGHGSAFPVWIALGLIAWLRRDRPWRVLLPLVLGLGVLLLWRLATRVEVGAPPAILGVDTYFGSIVTVLGRTWAASAADTAMVTGVAMLVAIGLTVVDAVKRRGTASTPQAGNSSGWVGLGVHMALAAVLIGLGRGRFSNVEGLSARYSIIGLLAVGALLVLLAMRAQGRVQRYLVPIALVVGLSTYAVGSTSAHIVRKGYPGQPVLAVAMQTGATAVVKKMNGYPENLDKYRRLGIYPFTSDFTLGCGEGGPELGSRIDVASVPVITAAIPKGGDRTAGFIESPAVTGDTTLTGWSFVGGEQADCVVVTDGSGTVAGGGAVGLPRRDVSTEFGPITGRAGWEAVARPGLEDGLVFVSREGELYRLGAQTDGKP
ncbi:hypothetical protein [Amycolatopsis sp. cmx-11-32]|uniref:hypothetical protein n=1 Tax=Amycolatopsis sp. cmx-11-32 TaxID=2785796 RepID=UPI0039E49288